MSACFVKEANFIIDCAASSVSTLRRILVNCTQNQFQAIVEAVANVENITRRSCAIKLAKDLTEKLLDSSEGLWREILRKDCAKLRAVLACIANTCLQDEFLSILCCEHEDV